MTLNDHLVRNGLVAEQTDLTVRDADGNTTTLIGQTRWVDGISESARDQIEQAQAMRLTFEPVDLKAFGKAN